MFAQLYSTKNRVVLSGTQGNTGDHIIGQLRRKPAN